MAWCPKCKCEYVEGITKCADCGCDLVDKLEEKEKEQSYWENEVNARAMAMAMTMKEESEQIYEKEPYEEDKTEDLKETESERTQVRPSYKGTYVNNEEKAEENRTSAYTLLLVGSVGLILILLFFFDVLPIHRTVVNKYMVSGVMGVLFILFIVMGFVSMKNSRILAKKACKENNLTVEIKKWCRENLKKEKVDAMLSLEDEPSEELKYFQRFEKMKAMIQNQFMNLDEGYLDRLIDEIYPEIFEEAEA